MNKFKYKNVKSFYYLKNLILLLVPRIFYRLKLKSELNKLHQYDRQYITIKRKINLLYHQMRLLLSKSAIGNLEI